LAQARRKEKKHEDERCHGADGTVVVAPRCFPGGAFLPEGFGMPHVENGHIVETTDEARAGVTGHNVRYVLLIGTALAVVWVLFAAGYVVTTG
jgi:hypothetical protein